MSALNLKIKLNPQTSTNAFLHNFEIFVREFGIYVPSPSGLITTIVQWAQAVESYRIDHVALYPMFGSLIGNWKEGIETYFVVVGHLPVRRSGAKRHHCAQAIALPEPWRNNDNGPLLQHLGRFETWLKSALQNGANFWVCCECQLPGLLVFIGLRTAFAIV
nr:hypothetical protein [Hyphomonas atlantica]